jgi:hypothetical protein
MTWLRVPPPKPSRSFPQRNRGGIGGLGGLLQGETRGGSAEELADI